MPRDTSEKSLAFLGILDRAERAEAHVKALETALMRYREDCPECYAAHEMVADGH